MCFGGAAARSAFNASTASTGRQRETSSRTEILGQARSSKRREGLVTQTEAGLDAGLPQCLWALLSAKNTPAKA